MPLAVVITLQALEDHPLPADTGAAARTFWEGYAPTLFGQAPWPAEPGSCSPLMAGDGPLTGTTAVGDAAWCRVTALSEQALEAALSRLPAQVEIAGGRWQVTQICTQPDAHPCAGQTAYATLVNRHLVNMQAPRAWRVTFATPTSFRTARGTSPFPTPRTLVESWAARWEAFGPVALPAGLGRAAERGLRVARHSLRTCALPGGEGLGCTGTLELQARRMKTTHRAAVDMLAAFAFFAGSGTVCPPGSGVTQAVSLAAETTPVSEAGANWWFGKEAREC